MKHKPIIICIDFDGTCVTHEYPKIGRYIGAEPVLRKFIERGDKLILWTMRHDKELEDAVAWFHERNIPLFGINCNPEQITWTNSPKAYAHLYIDDAAFGCPLKKGLKGERPYVNWERIEKKFFPVKKTSNKVEPECQHIETDVRFVDGKIEAFCKACGAPRETHLLEITKDDALKYVDTSRSSCCADNGKENLK